MQDDEKAEIMAAIVDVCASFNGRSASKDALDEMVVKMHGALASAGRPMLVTAWFRGGFVLVAIGHEEAARAAALAGRPVSGADADGRLLGDDELAAVVARRAHA